MSTYTTIGELKRQCNIEADYSADDIYLQTLLDVAEVKIADDCNNGISGCTVQTLPIPVKQAMLMLAAHLYINRTPVAFANTAEIPYSIKYLISASRNLITD